MALECRYFPGGGTLQGPVHQLFLAIVEELSPAILRKSICRTGSHHKQAPKAFRKSVNRPTSQNTPRKNSYETQFTWN
jgi:hypothetical protein